MLLPAAARAVLVPTVVFHDWMVSDMTEDNMHWLEAHGHRFLARCLPSGELQCFAVMLRCPRDRSVDLYVTVYSVAEGDGKLAATLAVTHQLLSGFDLGDATSLVMVYAAEPGRQTERAIRAAFPDVDKLATDGLGAVVWEKPLKPAAPSSSSSSS